MFELKEIQVIRSQRLILDIEQLQIPAGRLTVILGHNGSGKSTLVNLLARQFVPDRGHICFHGKPCTQYRNKPWAQQVAFLPQKLPEVAGLTVEELVRLGRYPWRGVFGRWQAEDQRIIQKALQQTGIEPMSQALASQLSGGERQRAWIAMLLAQQSGVMILDEPTSALDIRHQYQVMQLLSELNQQTGKGIIVILHDLNLALKFAQHVIALKQGRLAFHGPVSLLEDAALVSALYTTPIELIDHPHQPHKVAIICDS